MSRHCWLSCIAAVGIALAGAVYTQPLGDDTGDRAHASKSQDAPQTDQAPLGLESIKNEIERIARALESSIDKPKSPEEEDRANRDLRAQEQMAWWALWTAFAALASVVLMIVAVFLLWRTLVYTKGAAEATADAARLAKQANELLTNNSTLELRAYLSVEPAGINNLINRADGIGVVEVKNVGKLPARNVFVYCDMQIRDDRAAILPVVLDTESVSRVIQPGASLRQGSASVFPSDQIRADGKEIFVWGVVYYDIGDRVRRFTRFCHRYTGDAYDRTNALNKRPRESIIIIDASHARYHVEGNDAN